MARKKRQGMRKCFGNGNGQLRIGCVWRDSEDSQRVRVNSERKSRFGSENVRERVSTGRMISRSVRK